MTNTMLGLLAAILLIPILAEAGRGVALEPPGSQAIPVQAGAGGSGPALGVAGTVGTGGGGTVGTGAAGTFGGAGTGGGTIGTGEGGMGGSTGGTYGAGEAGSIGTGAAGTVGTGAGGLGMNSGAAPIARDGAKSPL